MTATFDIASFIADDDKNNSGSGAASYTNPQDIQQGETHRRTYGGHYFAGDITGGFVGGHGNTNTIHYGTGLSHSIEDSSIEDITDDADIPVTRANNPFNRFSEPFTDGSGDTFYNVTGGIVGGSNLTNIVYNGTNSRIIPSATSDRELEQVRAERDLIRKENEEMEAKILEIKARLEVRKQATRRRRAQQDWVVVEVERTWDSTSPLTQRDHSNEL